MSLFNDMKDNSTIFTNGNSNNPSNADQIINNVGVEGSSTADNVVTQEMYQPHDPYNVLDHHNEDAVQSVQYVDHLLNVSRLIN